MKVSVCTYIHTSIHTCIHTKAIKLLAIRTHITPQIPAVCRIGYCLTHLRTTGQEGLQVLQNYFVPRWQHRLFVTSVIVKDFEVDRKALLLPGLCSLLYQRAISLSQQKPASNLLI